MICEWGEWFPGGRTRVGFSNPEEWSRERVLSREGVIQSIRAYYPPWQLYPFQPNSRLKKHWFIQVKRSRARDGLLASVIAPQGRGLGEQWQRSLYPPLGLCMTPLPRIATSLPSFIRSLVILQVWAEISLSPKRALVSPWHHPPCTQLPTLTHTHHTLVYTATLVFCWLPPFRTNPMRAGTLSLLAEPHAHPRTPPSVGSVATATDLSPQTFSVFHWMAGGGPMAKFMGGNLARGHRIKQFHQCVHWITVAKATGLECARQNRWRQGRKGWRFPSSPTYVLDVRQTLIMIHLLDQCFVPRVKSHTCQCINNINQKPNETVLFFKSSILRGR